MSTARNSSTQRAPVIGLVAVWCRSVPNGTAAIIACAILLGCQLSVVTYAAQGMRLSKEYPVIPLVINYKIENADDGEVRAGLLGGTCRTGDLIHLSVSAENPCHLMVFCIDSMMVPIPVLPSNAWSSVLFEGKTLPISPRKLNKVTGTEIYYVVASLEEFTFDEISPFLDTTLSLLEGMPSLEGKPYSRKKGSHATVYELRLPPKGKFSSDFIYFNHLPAKDNPAQISPN